MKFVVRFGNERLITPTGLGIAGLLLKKTELKKQINVVKLKDNANPFIKNGDIAISYIGLLCQGKSDFDDVREMLEDKEFYTSALEISNIPSSETLRQRLDMAGKLLRPIILEENINMLKAVNAELTPCYKDWLPLDIDVSPFDNSKTKKEGVSYTYKKFDGYSPIFAYLGEEGYQINMEFREGSQNCQKNTDNFLKETLLLSKKLTASPILVRMDCGNDSVDNLKVCHADGTSSDYIIKRNIRREKISSWQAIAEESKNSKLSQPRDGKNVYTGSVYWDIKNIDHKVRVVYQVIERTSLANGQILLIPETEVQTFWTSLDLSEEEIIELYKAHGTSEQFHSEIKTDMDLERLPSGNFATNALVLELAILAYNILRIIGQESLKKDDVAIRNGVKRRRLKTVIQNLITIASHIVKHARQVYINLGRSNIWRFAFKRIYETFA
jgi:hypothetical protein